MEARTNWGILSVSLAVALVLIVISYFIATWQAKEPENISAGQALETPSREGIETAEWRSALDAIATQAASTSGEYRAPEELGTSQAVSQELVATYFKLKSQNQLGTKTADDELNALIERNVTAIQPSKTYTASSVATDSNATLDSYAEAVGNAMERSAGIKEYELTTFARTVGVEDYNGTPTLMTAASVYRIIERDLLGAKVPPPLASQHAQVLTSVAYLAQSVELMGGWTGDPLDALAYVDAFVKAERQTQVAFNALFAGMIEFGKQP